MKFLILAIHSIWLSKVQKRIKTLIMIEEWSLSNISSNCSIQAALNGFSIHTDEFKQPGGAEANHRSNHPSDLLARVPIDDYFPNEQVYFPRDESPIDGGCSLEPTICKSSPRFQGW